MAAQKNSIEFLKHEDWETGTGGKLLKWALTVGRHIVIFTELIVILAFLSRFKFDRDLTDTTEEVKQKQSIVANSANFEQDFRDIQNQLSVIENLKTNQPDTDPIIDGLAEALPPDVYLSEVNTTGNQVNLNAIALSETGLAVFINNLKSSKKFTKITLSQISYGGEADLGIKFQVKTEFIKNGS